RCAPRAEAEPQTTPRSEPTHLAARRNRSIIPAGAFSMRDTDWRHDMKKMFGGLLMAATILTPLGPAFARPDNAGVQIAQRGGERGERGSQGRRGGEARVQRERAPRQAERQRPRVQRERAQRQAERQRPQAQRERARRQAERQRQPVQRAERDNRWREQQ